MWELKPQKSEDYPGQLDLFVGKSMFPDMGGGRALQRALLLEAILEER